MKKLCEYDQVEFEAKRKDAKYCSTKCRVAAAREAGFDANGEPFGKLKELGETVEVEMATTAEQARSFTKPVKKPYDREKSLAAFRKMGLEEVTWLTTGIPEFDELTMIPRGRVTQIQGPYAVGKTTLCLNMLKGLSASQQLRRVLYIDSEASLNPNLMVDMELDDTKIELYNRSAFIEDIYDVIIDALNSNKKYDMIILDSLAACTFRVEAANEAADANIGQKAKIVGKLMRIAPMLLKAKNTALVIINQERETIGGYGPIKYTPGGMGVPYAASLIVALKTTKAARFPKNGPPFKGHTVVAEIIKSKVNDPWRKKEFKLFYGGSDAKAEVQAEGETDSRLDSGEPAKTPF